MPQFSENYFMKLFLTFFICLFCFQLFAKDRHLLLECLGQEELILHKNHVTGPNYRLNQFLIEELAAASDIQLKENYVNLVCNEKDFSPSVALLRLLLIKGLEIYNLPSKKNVYERALQKGTIESLLDRIPHVFFQYIASLQALTDDPKCLNRHVKNLDYFILRFRYLEGDLDANVILAETKKVNEIFQSLKGLDEINDRCKKAKLKKKEKAKMSELDTDSSEKSSEKSPKEIDVKMKLKKAQKSIPKMEPPSTAKKTKKSKFLVPKGMKMPKMPKPGTALGVDEPHMEAPKLAPAINDPTMMNRKMEPDMKDPKFKDLKGVMPPSK